MKVVAAFDSFKSSMSSIEITGIISRVIPNVTEIPLADGGEGSLQILNKYKRLEKIELEVDDAYMNRKSTYFLYEKSTNTAYIESALICGIEGIDISKVSIYDSSSIGVGQAIKCAIDTYNCKHIYIFLGGTASNDGGFGLMSELGYKFYDKNNQHVKPTLNNITAISSFKRTFNTDTHFYLVSDVENSLLGPFGATHVFGPQKGVTVDILEDVEDRISLLARMLDTKNEARFSSGAAGGISYGLMNAGNSTILSGIEFFSKLSNLESYIMNCDLVLTGEGKIDKQSFYGKTISHIIDLCRKYHKPYYLVCGYSELSIKELGDPLCKGILQISVYSSSVEDSILNGSKYIKKLLSTYTFNIE